MIKRQFALCWVAKRLQSAACTTAVSYYDAFVEEALLVHCGPRIPDVGSLGRDTEMGGMSQVERRGE
jgi:hypothetical protein